MQEEEDENWSIINYVKTEKKCQEALAQIIEKDYEAELRKQGYSKIRSYGVCFYRKECIVRGYTR